jgi:hypothetical protein
VTQALFLLAIQGVLGAFDTLYYHEWKARLPARGPEFYPELRLHAARDFVYTVIFCTLPWLAFRGLWVVALSVLLVSEVAITLADFVVEDTVRKSLGGVYPGERVTHAVMGIIYGGMLASLVPVLLDWWLAPTALTRSPVEPTGLRWLLILMGGGVFISGVRDACAARGLPSSDWPWRRVRPQEKRRIGDVVVYRYVRIERQLTTSGDGHRHRLLTDPYDP